MLVSIFVFLNITRYETADETDDSIGGFSVTGETTGDVTIGAAACDDRVVISNEKKKLQ